MNDEKLRRTFEYYKNRYLNLSGKPRSSHYERGYVQGMSEVLAAFNEILNEENPIEQYFKENHKTNSGIGFEDKGRSQQNKQGN